MSQLGNLKGESQHWNLESDRQLLKGIKTTTEKTYSGIKGIIDLLEDLEQDADDCLVHLKHAVNWVNTLSYSKFIVNEIKPSTEETKKAKIEVKTTEAGRTYESALEKRRRAVEIAVKDLGIGNLEGDDAAQGEGESLDGRTVAAGGGFVTARLKGRLPYFVGSREFRASRFVGLRREGGLSEESLEKLKREDVGGGAGESRAEAAGRESPVVKEPEKNPVPAPAIENREEKNFMMQPVKIPSAHVDILNSYMPSSSTNPFALADNEEDEDDMILPYNKHLDSKEKEEAEVEVAKENRAEPKPPARNTVALASKEADEFEKLCESRISVTQAPKPNYMQKMSKLFDFDDDEEEDRLKEDPSTLIKKYKKEPAKMAKSQTIEPSINKPKEPSKIPLFAASHEDSAPSKLPEQSPAKPTLSDKKEKPLVASNAPLVAGINSESPANKPFELLSDSEDSSPEETQKAFPFERLAQSSSTSTQEDKGHATQPNVKASGAKEELEKEKLAARTSSKLFSDFEESKENDALNGKMSLFSGSAKKKEVFAEKSALSESPKKDALFSNIPVEEKPQLFGSITGERKPTRESLFGEAVKADKLFSESTKGKNSLFDAPANMHQSLFNTEVKSSLFAEPTNLNQSLIGGPTDSLFGKKSSSPLKKDSLFANIASDGANLFGSSSNKPSESLFKSSIDKKQSGISSDKKAPNKKEISERLAKFLNDDDD